MVHFSPPPLPVASNPKQGFSGRVPAPQARAETIAALPTSERPRAVFSRPPPQTKEAHHGRTDRRNIYEPQSRYWSDFPDQAPPPAASHSMRGLPNMVHHPPSRAETLVTLPTSAGPPRSEPTEFQAQELRAGSVGGSSSTPDLPLRYSNLQSWPTDPPAPVRRIQIVPGWHERVSLSALLPENRAPRVQSTQVLDSVWEAVKLLSVDLSSISHAYEMLGGTRRRRRCDEGRRREEEHEKYTGEMLTDNQISYNDAHDMFVEFKSPEAVREAKEDEDEYETYCSEVFQKVYDILQHGIKVLTDRYLNIINDDIPDATAGKDRWDKAGGVELAELLEGLLELRKHIEARHEEVQEAIIERDRRFKRSVFQLLFASGDVAMVKSTERYFEVTDGETYASNCHLCFYHRLTIANSIHKAAEEKLQRAKQLIEVVEEPVIRGLEAELGYIADINAAVLALIDTPCDMSRVKHDLICAYNTLKDLKDTSIRFFEAHFTTEILLNESISEAALAKDRLGGSGGDKTEVVGRQREIADHQSNEGMQERVGHIDSAGCEFIRGVCVPIGLKW